MRGFTVVAQQTYIMTIERLDRLINFPMIKVEGFATISRSSSRHTTPFMIGTFKLSV